MKITKERKVDKRIKIARFIKQNKQVLKAMFVLGILFALIFTPVVYKWLNPPMLSPLGRKIDNKVVVNATEIPKPFCKDAIGCIRDIGESQGRSNKTIMTMIRIAQKESNMNPLAKNRKSSARGLFQIIAGTWYSNDCVGDKYNYQDNITCAYKILDNQGLYAWEVCNNGSAKCY